MNQSRRKAVLPILALVAWTMTLSATAVQSASSFFEPFDELSDSRWFVSNGWTNGDHQSCLWHKDAVEIQSGKLLLSLVAADNPDHGLSCGEVQTNERFGYGTFEVRMKVPYATGMNANMFTFIGEPQGRPHNEIDFEFIAPNEPILQTNFHTAESSENTELHKMPDDDRYHVYSFIWEPRRIRWFVDGELIRDLRSDGLPDEPQKLYLSLWSTSTLRDWMGVFRSQSAPQTLEVDWIAYTKLGDGCSFEQSVLCQSGSED